MNPAVPRLLSDVLAMAETVLGSRAVDPQRHYSIERLVERVEAAAEWPTDQPRRFVNDWTLMLLKLMRKLDRLGPLGDGDERPRATTLAMMLFGFVQADLAAALEVQAGVPLPDSHPRAGRPGEDRR